MKQFYFVIDTLGLLFQIRSLNFAGGNASLSFEVMSIQRVIKRIRVLEKHVKLNLFPSAIAQALLSDIQMEFQN